MITLAQARSLRPGTTLYSTVSFNKKGEPHKAQITSVKLWKTRPDHILIKWKHGLYQHGSTDQTQLDGWALTEEEAKDARGA